MEVTRISGQTGVGGVYVNSVLKETFDCSGTITFNWNRVEKADLTRLHNAIVRGYVTTRGNVACAIIDMLASCAQAPKFPTIGYMGKKAMNVLVPKAKAQQYRTDMIAAAHMLDVDLRSAMSIRSCDEEWDDKYTWLCVSSWEVSHHVKSDAPAPTKRWGRRQDGAHLKPATSKLASLVASWQEELLPDRQPLLDWISHRPALTFRLGTGIDV